MQESIMIAHSHLMVLRSRFQAVQKQTYNNSAVGLVHDIIMALYCLMSTLAIKKGPISLIEVSKVFWAYFNWGLGSAPLN